MTPSAKSRQPRLRASCDGCFLAKVKCSKGRPMCSRCLSCGIVCNYSPSSRAGKPKPENSHSPRVSTVHNTQPMQMYSGDDAMSSLPRTAPDQVYPLDNWDMPCTSGDGSMARNLSLATDMSMFGLDGNGLAQLDPITAAHPEFFPTQTPWAHTTNLTGTPNTQMPFVQSQPYVSPMQPYLDQKPNGMNLYTQTQISPNTNLNYLPSPNTTPIAPPALYQHSNGHQCECFSSCLQSLLSLHNTSGHNLPLFEVLCHVNDKAVDECATIMACKTCFNQFGGDNSIMLLATIFAKIATSYRDAIRVYCGYVAAGMPEGITNGIMSDGMYAPTSEEERQSRAERLDRAIRKLGEPFSRFQRIHQANMKPIIDDIGQMINQCRTIIEFVRNDANMFNLVTWNDTSIKDEA
ncbi:hypothetical protein EV127DRAFT_412415 [Xylaria flabelliformis]|nr:hypothetical protein EV127DRAFT_412415 [Xylaria flabelliformis]